MDARVARITPEKAQMMLAKNPINRALSPGRVHIYAETMRRGEWRLNGEAIKLNGDGTLLDGQHRLAAVVESDVATEFLVVTGLHADDQKTMDLGKKRSLGDLLSIRGEENPNPLAAAVRIVYAYELTAIPVTKALPTTQRPTPTLGLECLDRHPGLRTIEAPQYAPGFPHSALMAFSYIFSYVDVDDSIEFFRLLTRGGGSTTSAAIVLRERMVRHIALRQPLSEMQRAALTVRAFNHWREGTPLVRLTAWKGGGASPERFPTLDGTSFPFRMV